jgi:hypothetical protein
MRTREGRGAGLFNLVGTWLRIALVCLVVGAGFPKEAVCLSERYLRD